MTEAIKSYPLEWPAGWRRNKFPVSATFTKYKNRLSVFDGIERVLAELDRLRVKRDDIVISTNLRTRLDGMPRSDQAEPTDSGVAVYWRRPGKVSAPQKTECMAADRYTRVADNLAAIAATLEAMRAIERHGGAEILDRAFAGFIALPAPEQPWQVLGLATSNPSRGQIDDAYRRLASEHHPDRGGDSSRMARINQARDELYERMTRP